MAVKQQRYREISDNDGHHYVIKVEDEDAFYIWVEAMEDEETSFDFEDARIDGGTLTFTEPRIDDEEVGNY
jgi:hypothetical protein